VGAYLQACDNTDVVIQIVWLKKHLHFQLLSCLNRFGRMTSTSGFVRSGLRIFIGDMSRIFVEGLGHNLGENMGLWVQSHHQLQSTSDAGFPEGWGLVEVIESGLRPNHRDWLSWRWMMEPRNRQQRWQSKRVSSGMVRLLFFFVPCQRSLTTPGMLVIQYWKGGGVALWVGFVATAAAACLSVKRWCSAITLRPQRAITTGDGEWDCDWVVQLVKSKLMIRTCNGGASLVNGQGYGAGLYHSHMQQPWL
jgi:hypothetical protein